MNFLSPTLLWGLFAAAIPVIIHLLNRRRFRTVRWAAMDFLLKASRESRGKKRLKYILILTCRALAIAALVTAVARPLIGSFLGWGGGAVETIVLVLDRSASMELSPNDGTPSQRQAVLERIAKTVEEMGSPRVVLLDSAIGEIQEIPSPDVLPEISSTRATDTQADIPGLLTKAVDYLQITNPGRSEIWLASDLQRVDWSPENTRWQAVRTGLESLPTKSKLRILTSKRDGIQNYSLELLGARRIEDEFSVDLRISRVEDLGPTAIPLTLSVKGAASTERVTIKGQELRLQKRIKLSPLDNTGFGWVGIPSDNNPTDNAVFFAFGEKQNLNTWIVTDSPASEAIRDLKKAAAPPGFDRYQCNVISPAQITKLDWTETSLVIWQAPLPKGATATFLTQYIETGGTALFLPPKKDDSDSILGMSWGPLESAPKDQFFINGSWTRDDGPWRDGIEGNPLPISAIRSILRRPIQGEAATLAEWDDQSPLMARKIHGKGTAIFLGTLPEDTWSNLEHTALHLVTVQRLIEKGMDRLHSKNQTLAGAPRARTKNDEIRTRLDDHAPFDPAQEEFRSGVYQLGQRTLAVNRVPSESSIQTLSKDELSQLMDDTPYSLFEEQDTNKDLIQEAWRLFLIAMLFFLISEAALCLQPKPVPSS